MAFEASSGLLSKIFLTKSHDSNEYRFLSLPLSIQFFAWNAPSRLKQIENKLYTILLALASASLIGVASFFVPHMHWAFSILIGLIAGVATLIIASRKMMAKLQPLFVQASKQAEAKKFKLAIATLESLLPYGKWQVMLKSQIYSQMGVIYYAEKNEEKALECLSQGTVRAPDAQMILASMYYRRKEYDKMKNTFDLTIKINKKQMILYNTYAFMLKEIGENEKALEILQKGLKVMSDNEATKDNLLRLQNNKKMNMKPFGMPWYTLQLERPPISMMQNQFAGRAGFRQKRAKGR